MKINEKWTLFLIATFVTFFGIADTLLKGSSALDEMPVNEAFDDIGFYKCVVDSYNLQNGTDYDYDYNLNDVELNEITSISCLGTENDKINSFKGIDKLLNLTSLSLDNVYISKIDLSNNSKLDSLSFNNCNFSDSLVVYKDESYNLENPIILPDDSSLGEFSWNINNEEVATIGEDGVLKTNNIGTTEMLLKLGENQVLSRTLNVIEITSKKYDIKYNVSQQKEENGQVVTINYNKVTVDTGNKDEILSFINYDEDLGVTLHIDGVTLKVMHKDRLLKEFRVVRDTSENGMVYYSDDGIINLECPGSLRRNQEFVCRIVLTSKVPMTVYKISAKLSSDKTLVYKNFVYSGPNWNKYIDTNYTESDGFTLTSDGSDGNAIIGDIVYTVADTSNSNTVFKLHVEDLVLYDNEGNDYSVGDINVSTTLIGNDISTLDNITLSEGSLNETFDKEKTEYTANVDSDKVVIEAIKTDSFATVTGGIGEVNLEYGENVFEIVVTSESGLYTKTYTLTITRENNNVEPPEDKSNVNTLDSITLSNGSLNETFDKNDTEYTANIDSDSVIIEVSKTDSKSVVSGDIGEVSLEYGENVFEIVVTSESGIEKKYILTITRENNNVEPPEDNYVIEFDKSLNIDNNNKFIKYLSVGTTIDDLLNNVSVTGATVNVYSSSGNKKNGADVLASGDLLVSSIDGVKKEEYQISVMGDSDGNGRITLKDLSQIRKHYVGYKDENTGEIYKKDGIYFYAIDLNKDSRITLQDILRIRKILVGN